MVGWLWAQGLTLALAQGLVQVGWLVGASALALAEAQAAAEGDSAHNNLVVLAEEKNSR